MATEFAEDCRTTLIHFGMNVVDTGADVEAANARNAAIRRSNRANWDRVIDRHLLEWGRNPGLVSDDDFEPPSRATVHRAIQIATQCRDKDLVAPTRVVPNADGEIVFEREGADSFESISVLPDGGIVTRQFVAGRLIGVRRS